MLGGVVSGSLATERARRKGRRARRRRVGALSVQVLVGLAGGLIDQWASALDFVTLLVQICSKKQPR